MMPLGERALVLTGLIAGGALLSVGLIWLLRPWLLRYAMARPSARGLHTTPTPQGGGIAVIVTCLAVAAVAASLIPLAPGDAARLTLVLAAAGGLGALGFVDDVRPLPAAPRLLLQLAAMTVGVLALPEGGRVLPMLPLGIERVVLVLGGTWFINLTNFMDGMDWVTVIDTVPLMAWLVLLWAIGGLSAPAGILAIGLLGGLLGYAPFNRPVARLFLGDVGSLAIGFLIAYALFSLAGTGHLVAALVLPLYALADTGITLARRLLRRERIWEPHRDHFYQAAIARGLSVWQVLGRIGATNAVLAVVAWVSLDAGAVQQALGLTAAVALVAMTIWSLGAGT